MSLMPSAPDKLTRQLRNTFVWPSIGDVVSFVPCSLVFEVKNEGHQLTSNYKKVDSLFLSFPHLQRVYLLHVS